MDQLKFGITLEDGVSREAGKAAEALRGLETELHGTKDAATVGKVGVESIATGAHHAGTSIHGMSAEAKEAKGVIEGFAEGLGELYPTLTAVRLGAAAVGFVLADLAVEAVKSGAEIVKSLVETALEVGEVNDKLEATFDALGKGPGAGKATLTFLNDLAKELPQSRDQLAQWTKQFQAIGITDLGQLKTEITAVASAQAIMGDQGAQAYTTIRERIAAAVEAHQPLKLATRSLQQLYQAGINFTDVAAHMGLSAAVLGTQLKAGTVDAAKFGDALKDSLTEKGKGPLEAMGNEIGTLGKKAKETFDHLFDDIDTSSITIALKDLIDLGDQGEASGQAIKDGIGPAIQDMADDIGIGIEKAKGYFLDLELSYVHVDNVIKGATGFNTLQIVLKAAEVGLDLFGASIHAVAQQVAPLATGMWDLYHAASAIGSLGKAAGSAIESGVNSLAGAAANAIHGGGSLPGHASGGIVTSIHAGRAQVQPAPGEGLASIGVGERILPARESRQIQPYALGGGTPFRSEPQNDNARGGVHVGHLEVHITAPQGVTDAKELSVVGLTIALERLQLAVGR